MSSEVYNNGKDKLIFQDALKITEENYGVYDKAERILRTSYMNCTNDDNFEGYIEVEQVESMIEDLCNCIENLEDEIRDLEDPPIDNLDYPEEEYDREQYFESKYGN